MANWPEFRPTELLAKLARAEVDFVVIGGVAIVVQAAPRFTSDLDICYATNRPNLERLGDLLVSLQARLRGVEDDVPFVPDADTLRRTQILPLTTREGDLDLLVDPPRCSQLRRVAETGRRDRPRRQLDSDRIAGGSDRHEARRGASPG